MKSLNRPLTGRHRTVAVLLAAVVVLAGAGAATTAAVADDNGRDRDRVQDSVLVRSTKVDLKQAADTAARAVTGTVTSVELEGRRGNPVWEADVVDAKGTEHEVRVDARTGAVTAAQPHHQGGRHSGRGGADDRHHEDD
ncbi:PepSY domain-containing protein [Streptomyces sp. NPDC001982]|uniref:PepSY domain-containing protein n=1 Tax=unclassified Streptomyces TaxID=2593676 RepID=UPI00331B1B89